MAENLSANSWCVCHWVWVAASLQAITHMVLQRRKLTAPRSPGHFLACAASAQGNAQRLGCRPRTPGQSQAQRVSVSVSSLRAEELRLVRRVGCCPWLPTQQDHSAHHCVPIVALGQDPFPCSAGGGVGRGYQRSRARCNLGSPGAAQEMGPVLAGDSTEPSPDMKTLGGWSWHSLGDAESLWREASPV